MSITILLDEIDWDSIIGEVTSGPLRSPIFGIAHFAGVDYEY